MNEADPKTVNDLLEFAEELKQAPSLSYDIASGVKVAVKQIFSIPMTSASEFAYSISQALLRLRWSEGQSCASSAIEKEESIEASRTRKIPATGSDNPFAYYTTFLLT